MTITITIQELADGLIELATHHAGDEEASLRERRHAQAIIERIPALYEAAGKACGAGRIAVFDNPPRR